jgi:rhodanese-related sulfurtransferase
MQHIRAAELKDWLEDPAREKPLLLDVREPWEFERCHIPGSVSVPMNGIPARLQELPPDRQIVVICHHGVRSFHVARFLDRNGFTRVINLTGGVDAWAKEADPTMPIY